MSVAFDNEVLERDHLLENISKDTETELYMATLTFVVILIVAVLFLLMDIRIRQRSQTSAGTTDRRKLYPLHH